MTLLTDWLADSFVAKQLFMISVVGLIVISMMYCVFWNLKSMVLSSLLQGVFDASIVLLSQTFLLNINPKRFLWPDHGYWGDGIIVDTIIG